MTVLFSSIFFKQGCKVDQCPSPPVTAKLPPGTLQRYGVLGFVYMASLPTVLLTVFLGLPDHDLALQNLIFHFNGIMISGNYTQEVFF